MSVPTSIENNEIHSTKSLREQLRESDEPIIGKLYLIVVKNYWLELIYFL